MPVSSDGWEQLRRGCLLRLVGLAGGRTRIDVAWKAWENEHKPGQLRWELRRVAPDLFYDHARGQELHRFVKNTRPNGAR